jgi:phosphatidylinositol phospholipase C, delta
VAGLLTTKGRPVPAIADTAVETPASASPQLLSPPPPPTTMSGTSHRRDHANSVPSYGLAAEQPQRSSGYPRRRSDGSASLGLGGSIRRKLREVKDVGGAYLSRSLSSRSSNGQSRKDECGASNSDLKLGMRRSISTRLSASSSAPRVGLSTLLSGGNIKRHGRSNSDVLWNRPSVAHSASELDVVYSPVFETSMSDLTVNGSQENSSQPVASSPKAITTTSDASSPQSAETTSSSTTDPLQLRPLSTIHEPEHVAEDVQSPSSSLSPAAALASDFIIPQLLLNGVPMLKVSAKKQKRYFFRLDADEGQIIWQSKKLRISKCPCIPRTMCVYHNRSLRSTH